MLQFLIIKAETIKRSMIEKYLRNVSFPYAIAEKEIYSAINTCEVCMTSSGTATLETAILQKPMVVIYKTSSLSWLLAKSFIKIPHIAMANVVAGKKVVPECIQFQATGKKIAEELKNIFTNDDKISTIKSELKKVKESLGSSGASQRAAQEILTTIGGITL